MAKKAAKKKPVNANPRRGKMSKTEDGAAAFESGAGAAAPKHFDAAVICDEMHLYYENGKQFMVRLPDARWSAWTEQAVIDKMRALPGRLVAIKAREGEQLSESKLVLLHARENRCLDGVLPSLPGYSSGIHDLASGERVLVKQAPRLITPTPGEWPTIKAIIDGRLNLAPGGGFDQTPYFHSWCKIAVEAIREGRPGQWRAGHAMILTGPRGCGKNRIQEQIITPMLGGYGRFADPAKFLFESDEFNGDVFAAEHLMLSEIPMPSQRTVDRTALAEKIKQVVANPAQRMRLMRTEPCTVSPFWRLTISVNDDPDKLRSLPMITSDFGDKVLVFHCGSEPLPLLQGNSMEAQQAFRDACAEELPHYLHWLANEWGIPEELKTYDGGKDATRFGFREFHHPVIKGQLFDDSAQAQLLALIDAAEFDGAASAEWDDDKEEWDTPAKGAKLWQLRCRGTVHAQSWENGKPVRVRLALWHDNASTLQLLLTGEGGCHCSVATMAKKFFQHNRIDRLLGLLAADEGACDRVAHAPTNKWKGWRIAAPSVV